MIPAQQGGLPSVGVYNNGERIIINKAGVHRGKDIAATDQYYLVGAFDGQDTGRTYWLYGCNSEINEKVTVSQRVGMKDYAKQESDN